MNIWLYALLGNLFIWFWIIIVFFVLDRFKWKIFFQKKIDYIIAFTVGLLLWIVFLWFLPKLFEASEHISGITISSFILLWFLIFYVFELVLHWHHCGEQHSHDHHMHNNWFLMLASTFAHNMFHGIVLYASFAQDIHIWIITTVAVLIHSIPQNIATYLIAHGKKKIAFVWALWWIFGVFVLFPFTAWILAYKFVVLALISWFLLYTALTDILPEISHHAWLKKKAIYLAFIIFWIMSYVWIQAWADHIHEHKHEA
jgi:zinc and cadmium transporter